MDFISALFLKMKSRRSKFGKTSNGIIIGGVVAALIAVVGIYFLTKKSVNVSSAFVNVSSPQVSVPVIYSILNQPQSYYENLTDPNVAINIIINIANTPLATIQSLPKDQQEYLGAIIFGLGDTFANNAAYTALDNSWSTEQKNVLEYVIGKLLTGGFNSKHSPVPVIYSILNQPQSYYENLTDPNVAINIIINIANTPLATIKSLPKDQQEYLGAIIWGLGGTFANNAAYTALDNSWSTEQKNVLEYVIGKLLMGGFNSKINSTFNSKHSPVPASRRGSTPASR